MTDFASLAIQIDARQTVEAGQSLDRLTQTGARTEQQMQRVTASAGQQRAGMQQLSYQIGDVAQGLSMATQAADPLKMAFMTLGQQGGQVVQALAMMRGEATGLIGFMSGPWGAGIIAATSVLGPLIARLMDVGNAAGEAEGALDKMIAKYRTAQAEKSKFRDAGKDLDALKQEAAGLEAYIKAHGVRNSAGQLMFVYSQQQRLSELNQQIREGTDAMDAERVSAWSLDKVMHGLGDTHEKAGHSARIHATGISAADKAAQAFTKSLEDMNIAISRSMNGGDMEKWANSLLGKLQGSDAGAVNVMRDEFARRTAAATQPMRDAAQATADWNTELDTALDRLTRIGGIGGQIAGYAKALSKGDFSGVGGATGVALQSIMGLNAGTQDVDGKKVAVTIGDRIASIFDGPNSKFGKTFKDVLQGGGTGIAIGASLFGSSNTGAQIGGGIGGAVGQAAGAALTKGMGAFMSGLGGPLGAVLGGVLGSVLGGIFGKKPSGSAVISNGGMSVTGNDGGIKSGLSSFGLGLQQGVSAIASKLGGSVGNYSVGIGAYKDYYQVSSNANDPRLGRSEFTKYSGSAVYDGKDAAAALRAAIAQAIQQGAIQGVRAGVNTLLQAGSDIEAQLTKALKFQGVFDDLKQATDPVGFALDQLTKKFGDLRTIFAEAGASAEDYAQLQQLLTIQQADAAQQARQDIVSKVTDPITMGARILELMGDTEKSVTATRLLEIAGLKDSLQPLQAMIYTLEDARSVIDKFTPLRDDLAKFRDELLGGDGSQSFGYLATKFRTTALAAANGDATAMAGLRGSASDYLSAAKDNASTLAEYNRARAEVLAATDKAIFAADTQIDYQQAVIDATKANGTILADMQANLATLSSQIVTTSSQVASILKRWDGGENGAPLQVEVVA